MRALIIFAMVCLLLISMAYMVRGDVLRHHKNLPYRVEDVELPEARKEYDTDYITEDIIPCIITYESMGNPNAIGSKGCIGLMQVSEIVLKEYNEWYGFIFDSKGQNPMPTGKRCRFEPLNIGDLYNPSINVKVGWWYLERLINHYIPEDKYSPEVLLACYHWGVGNMKKVRWNWKRSPKSTQWYIKKVLGCYECSQQR